MKKNILLITIMWMTGTICFSQIDSWTNIINNGFGNSNIDNVVEFKVFKNKIFAFTKVKNATLNKASIWFSSTGDAGTSNWQEVTSYSPSLTANTHILLGVTSTDFDGGYIYVGTTDSIYGASVYRSPDGLSWTQINNNGFGTPNNVYISQSGLVVYKGLAADTFLYAATSNETTGAQLWRIKYNDTNPSHWTKVLDLTSPKINTITWLHVDNDTLYLSTDCGARLFRSANGTTWVMNQSVGVGFGDSTNTNIAAIESFNGYLYATTGNLNGGQLWRSANKINWTQVTGNAFGKGASAWELHNLRVIDGNLWVTATTTAGHGAPVWRTSDGLNFIQSNTDGFGIPSITMGFTTTYGFNNKIYWGGQSVVTGAQIWRCTGINSITENNNNITINVYPNPTTDILTIENNDIVKNKTVSFYNMQGQRLFQYPIEQLKSEIDISELRNGMYILKIVSDEKVEIKKIQKQ